MEATPRLKKDEETRNGHCDKQSVVAATTAAVHSTSALQVMHYNAGSLSGINWAMRITNSPCKCYKTLMPAFKGWNALFGVRGFVFDSLELPNSQGLEVGVGGF